MQFERGLNGPFQHMTDLCMIGDLRPSPHLCSEFFLVSMWRPTIQAEFARAFLKNKQDHRLRCLCRRCSWSPIFRITPYIVSVR
jgi:hypothetical protein